MSDNPTPPPTLALAQPAGGIAGRLPAELLYPILSDIYLSDHCVWMRDAVKPDLPNCSRVSRWWRAVALPLLFRDLRLNIRTWYTQRTLAHWLCHDVAGPELATSLWPDCGLCAQHMPASGLAVVVRNLQLTDPSVVRVGKWRVNDVLSVVRRFSGLEYLELRDIWVVLSPPVPASSLLQVKKVKVWSPDLLRGPIFTRRLGRGSMDHYFTLLGLLGSVDELTLDFTRPNDLERWNRKGVQSVRLSARCVNLYCLDAALESIFGKILAQSTTLRHLEILPRRYSILKQLCCPPAHTTCGAAPANLLSIVMHTCGRATGWIADLPRYVSPFLAKRNLRRPLALVIMRYLAYPSASASEHRTNRWVSRNRTLQAEVTRLRDASTRLLAYLHTPAVAAALPAVTVYIVNCDKFGSEAWVRCAEPRTTPGGRQTLHLTDMRILEGWE